jgi:methyl-accepting chemotaxis protein
VSLPRAGDLMNIKLAWKLLAIFAIAGGLAAAVHGKSLRDREAAMETYRVAGSLNASSESRLISKVFDDIYTNIRTISFLPGVRMIDRHGANLDADGLATIQQNYNNLAASVAVSEVYIVPVDFDHTKIDPVTGKGEEPILMFDELIVGAGKRQETETAVSTADLPEEVETEEYKLLAEQLAFLRKAYPNQAAIKDLAVPMVSGREVITCDNTEFVSSRNDADRKGLIFSVPFYGLDGALKGSISVIIRTNVLRALLPVSDAAIVNMQHGYFVAPAKAGVESAAGDHARRGQPDPDLLFSSVIPIASADRSSEWVYWRGQSNEVFEEGAEMASILQFRNMSWLILFISAAALAALIWHGERGVRRLSNERRRLAKELEARSKEIAEMTERRSQADNADWRQREMGRLADQFEVKVQSGLAALGQTAEMLGATAAEAAEIASGTAAQTEMIRSTSRDATQAAIAVATAAGQVSEAIEEISRSTNLSRDTIASAHGRAEIANGSVLDVDVRCREISGSVALINRIASQINLLSLNATIEAARAGEAGRGFSVVATEVKQLSNQVSAVASEITARIEQIAGAAGKSIGHVDETLVSLGQIQETAMAVAASVEEQRAGTQQIASGIEEAAGGVQRISTQIAVLADGSRLASAGAECVRKAADELRQLAAMIKAEASEFVQAVRAA